MLFASNSIKSKFCKNIIMNTHDKQPDKLNSPFKNRNHNIIYSCLKSLSVAYLGKQLHQTQCLTQNCLITLSINLNLNTYSTKLTTKTFNYNTKLIVKLVTRLILLLVLYIFSFNRWFLSNEALFQYWLIK